MSKKGSKGEKIIKIPSSSVPKCENKAYCLFCYKLVNYNTNQTSFEPKQDKENERVETCDNFYNCLLRNKNNYADNSRSEKKDETDKHSSMSFKQIQQICLGACNDCFYVINMCCTVFKEIEDLQSSLKTSLKTLRSVMHEAGKVTARMKLFRESFALATAQKKKRKRKRKCDNNGPNRSLQEVLEFRQTIFETCKLHLYSCSILYFEHEQVSNYLYVSFTKLGSLNVYINGRVKNRKSNVPLSAESKPSDHNQLSDNLTNKESSTVNPPSISTTSKTNDEIAQSAEDKDNADSDIEILNVIKSEVEEMTLDLHPSFYTEDNVMNDTDLNSINMLMMMTEGRSESNFRFKCIKCEKSFSTEDQLISHASSHFYTQVNIQATDDTNTENYLSSNNHPFISYDHSGNKSTVVPVESNENDELACLFCSFTTDQITKLVEHETTLHTPTLIGEIEPENFVGDGVRCPRCLNFLSLKNKKQNLRRHYINCHMEKKCSVKCESCNAIFKGCNMKEMNDKLNRHYQHIHAAGRTKQFACKICDKRFDNGYKLKQHLISHEEKKFKCSICQKKLSTKFSEIRHMKRFH